MPLQSQTTDRDHSQPSSNLPTVLIYRDELLPPSETFILSQARSLTRFEPVFVGSREIEGLASPDLPRFVLNPGGARGFLKEVAFKSLGTDNGFSDQLAALKPQLLHAHFGPDGVWAMPLAKQLGIPLIVTFHGYDATMSDSAMRSMRKAGRLYLRRRARLFKQAAGFLAVSQFVKSKMLEKGFPEEKIRVHYMGIDTTAFRPVPETIREPIVLFVGRLVENKGCHLLIEAMSTVQQKLPDVRLVVIGDGPQKEHLRKLAQHLPGKAEFLGRLPSLEVKEWMNRALLLSVPSHTIHSGASEGLGTVFLEAQSMELPVVSFATGGVPEAVEHGHTGLLAEEGNVSELAHYVEILVGDKNMRARLARASRIRTQERFDLSIQTRNLERYYHEVVEEKRC